MMYHDRKKLDTDRKKKILLYVVSLAITSLFIIAGLVWMPPEDDMHSTCSFRKLTGLPCGTCGMSRSVTSFFHGRIIQSILFHPGGPIVSVVIIWIWINSLLALIFPAYDPKLYPDKGRKYAWLVIIIILVGWAYQIIRAFTLYSWEELWSITYWYTLSQ